MKLYWDDLSDITQASVLVSEYVHMRKIEDIEKWVALHEAHMIEDELSRRGVLWDRNHEFLGSEHLYLESAVYHVETYARARKLAFKVIDIMRKRSIDRKDLVAPVARPATLSAEGPMVPLALFLVALLAMASVVVIISSQ
jgi:hypothetical protein